MSEVAQLLEVFRVEKLIRGLRGRLGTAEQFLSNQRVQLEELAKRLGSVEGQIRQLRASVAGDEGEIARIDQRMEDLREKMNSAKTAKEYNAFLAELNNYKQAKGQAEESMLESMTKLDELVKQAEQLREQHAEREKIVAHAAQQREEREKEVSGRLDELTAQRDKLTQGVPSEALGMLEALIASRGEDAMAPVEVVDRKRYEYSCSACMMALPMETVSSVGSGRITACVNCGCILYTEEEIGPAKKTART